MTPTLQKIASATSNSILSPKSVLKRRYDFHRAVEKLVQEKFVPSANSSPIERLTAELNIAGQQSGTLTNPQGTSNVPNGLDTSSESGYGSDQDSLNSQTNQVQTSSPQGSQNTPSGTSSNPQGTTLSGPSGTTLPPPALPPRKK